MRVCQISAVRLDREWLRYYLLRSVKGRSKYGICVTCGADTVFIPEITASKIKIRQLLGAMIRGRVTPVTARDIVEDWLCG